MTLEPILRNIKSYHPGADTGLVTRAYEFAARAHAGQMRQSGDPYVTHPLSVANIITQLKLDVPSVCAGLLHDAVEDTSTTVEELTEKFGQEIAFLVDGVTKLGKLPWSTREERQAENFRKMLLAMARDIRVILVKFCDRLDNMRTLDHLPAEKQERIADETMQIYAPLANRLGIQWIKVELEDLSFKYLFPGEFEQLKISIAKTRRERERYISEVEKLVKREMDDASVKCRVFGRAKHLWSIRQKMKRTAQPFEDIHDAIGFRVITDSTRACYEALGVCHSAWKPIPGRFKDYIALPKPNMYQSLHTAVIGPGGERIEIQIRTEEMHLVAEQGIAAHWKYKEGRSSVLADEEAKFTWLRRMMEEQKEVKDPTEFIESVKLDLFGDEVYVFTPKGDVRALPTGSCPIDFAYAIHSDVGDHCSGARVNGVIVPLRYQLRNGDTLEIITTPNQKPNKDWLKLVKTSRAKTKIRHCLRKEQRDRALALGKDLLEKGLRKYGHSYAKSLKQGLLLGRGPHLHHRLRQDHEQAGHRRHRAGGQGGGAAAARRGEEPHLEDPAQGHRADQPERHQGAGRGRDPHPLRPLLQPAAGRQDRRLHHPRPRGHRAPARLPQGARSRPGAAHRRRVGRQGEGQPPGRHPGPVRRQARPAGAYFPVLLRLGREHFPGPLSLHRGRPGGEHLPRQCRGPRPAEGGHPRPLPHQWRLLGGPGRRRHRLTPPGGSAKSRDSMASRTKKTENRRARHHKNAGRKRKNRTARKSTPSETELFAGMGEPGKPAPRQR
jgi:GTP pyrophosphokinase